MFDLYQPKKSAMVPPSQLAAERRIKPYVCHGVARCVGPQLSWKFYAEVLQIVWRSLKDTSKFHDFEWILYILMLITRETAVLEPELAWLCLFDIVWWWFVALKLKLSRLRFLPFPTGMPERVHMNHWSYHLGPKRKSTSHNESSWNISICCFIPSQ